jgi:transcriptional regulator with XRE-family HTH domain
MLPTSKIKSRLPDLLKKRRKDLGLTQKQVARALAINSTEIIAMVEAGGRRITLDKIPALADILLIDRVGLCKLAIQEFAPTVYQVFWGKEDASAPDELERAPKPVSLWDEFRVKFDRLAPETQHAVLGFIDQMSKVETAVGR